MSSVIGNAVLSVGYKPGSLADVAASLHACAVQIASWSSRPSNPKRAASQREAHRTVPCFE